MERVVPVPPTVRSLHAVFTADPIEPVADIEAPPASLLTRFGAADDALDALARRPHAHLFAVEATPATAGRQLAATRTTALKFAADHDGVTVDLLIPRIVRGDVEQVDPGIASQWVALDLADEYLRSRGLEAFGLPELQIATGDPVRTGMVLAVAMGLAQRLITEWPAHDPVGPAAVTLHDIATGFADPEPAPREPALDLMIDLVDDHLAVTLIDDLTVLFS